MAPTELLSLMSLFPVERKATHCSTVDQNLIATQCCFCLEAVDCGGIQTKEHGGQEASLAMATQAPSTLYVEA